MIRLEDAMKLNCPCGRQATWALVYGCEQYQHVWEDHLCLGCLQEKLGIDFIPKNRVYIPAWEWTCVNGLYHDPGGETVEYHCSIDGWYATEHTPGSTARVLARKFQEIRGGILP